MPAADLPGAPTGSATAPPARRSFGSWLNRPRRILLALAAVWVVSVFDLGFTLLAWDTPHFVELNPLAARLLNGPDAHVMAFKLGLLGLGSMILLSLRRHSIAELASWFLLAAQVYVATRWFAYFDCILGGTVNPMIEV